MKNSTRLIKRKIGSKELDSVKYRRKELDAEKKDVRLLMRARNAWDSLREFREQRARGMRFCYGDQWGDPITIRKDGVEKTITMRKYLELEGNIPQQTNQIKSMVNTIVGVLIKEQNEPVCNAIDRDEQQYGEILTQALQANNSKNRIRTIHKLCTEDMIIGGLGVLHESYGFREGNSRREDSWTKYIDPNYMILETTMRDPRFWDVTMVGCWYSMPFHILAAQFVGRNGMTYDKLKNIYASHPLYDESGYTDLLESKANDWLTFMKTTKTSECCVAEIWTLETKERVRVHDTNEGTLEIIDADDTEMLKLIKGINEQRKEIAMSSGWTEDEVPTIELDYFVDQFWYCRFLAPDGTILWEEESPYPDRSHPFTIMATPFIDGRISGYITDAIDHQIAMNRALVLQDWVVRNQIKGFTMIPNQLVPDDMSPEEFVENGISLGNYFFYDAEKARGLKPEVFHTGAVSYDASNYLNVLKNLMESSTAVSGAIQGKTPYSGTSAALFAQQTMNSSTPIASLLADIRSFMEDAAIKKIKNIAEFYDPKRWELIVGSIDGIFDNANLKLNEIADIEFDVIIKESAETPVYRAIANDYLMSFFQAGAISLEELLENATLPFADKLLQKRQARQAEMEAAQAGEMGQGMAQHQTEDMENPVETAQYGVPVKSTRELVS